MNNISYSFLITLVAGLSTLLGGLLIFFKFKNTNKVISSSLAFASGVMITISVTDLIPSSLSGFLNNYYLLPSVIFTAIFIILGLILSLIMNRFIPDNNYANDNKLFKVGIVSLIAIILHNIPEGIATFMLSTKNIKLGLSLAIAITLHNIPEGISIAVPIYYSTKSKLKSLLYTFVSGASEPFGALLAYLFLAPYMSEIVMSILLSLIAGIMLSISLYELLPTSFKYNEKIRTIKYAIIGIVFMCISHLMI